MECPSTSDKVSEQWYNLMADYFGVKLDAVAVPRWYNEVAAKFRGITNGRLCEAIRWASNEKNYRHDPKQGKPTVSTLMRWLVLSHGGSESNPMNVKLACSLCGGSGWLPWSKELESKPEFTFSEYNLSVTVCIPCICSKGREAHSRTYPDLDASAQFEVAKRASKQRARWLKLSRQLESPTQVVAKEIDSDDTGMPDDFRGVMEASTLPF